MGCLVGAFVLALPRFVMVILWIFTDYLSDVYDGWVLPLLGFFLMPTTTLAYALAQHGRDEPGVGGVILIAVAVALDLGIWGKGRGVFSRD